MAVELALPERLDQVPAERIVEVRKRYRTEFHAFTDAVDAAALELRDRLHGVEDPEAVRQHLDISLRRRFETPLEDLRKALRGLGMRTGSGVLNHKFELGAAAAAAGAVFGDTAPTTASGVAVGVGVVTMRQTVAAERDALLAASPVSYLLRAEQGLKPASLVERVARQLRKGAGIGV